MGRAVLQTVPSGTMGNDCHGAGSTSARSRLRQDLLHFPSQKRGWSANYMCTNGTMWCEQILGLSFPHQSRDMSVSTPSCSHVHQEVALQGASGICPARTHKLLHSFKKLPLLRPPACPDGSTPLETPANICIKCKIRAKCD